MSSPAGLAQEALEEYLGQGVHLYIRGTRYLDCASGTFNLSLGYSTREVIDALHQQLDRCCHLSSDYTREKSAQIFELLREYLPEHLNSFWFRDLIGSTANECAIRIAQKATGKKDIVTLFLSHHGQSLAATGASGNSFRQASFAIPLVGALKIPAPTCHACFYGQRRDTCGMLCARRLEDFVEFGSSGQVAALLIEPILGNGGNIVPPPGYYRAIREVCDRLGILIIADEVQTGFGRTGTFFASTGIAKDLKPDIITFAKGAGGIGIPVAGVVMREELNVLEAWEHSTTSGANPLALVALEETIRYIRTHEVLSNVNTMSSLLRQGLHSLEADFPCMTNTRGEGLMLAFDLPTNIDASRFISIAKDNGLVLRGSRYGFGNTIKVRPALIITEPEIHEILSGLRRSLTTFQKGLHS